MVRVLLLALLLAIGLLPACGGGSGPGSVAASPFPLSFVHEGTPANTTTFRTFIDHPLLNGRPDLIVLMSLVSNPGGVFPGFSEDGFLTAEYSALDQQWVVRISGADPSDLAFNVTALASSSTAFVHTATAGNTSGHITSLSHPALDGNPLAQVMVTAALREEDLGGGGVYTPPENLHQIGVYFDSGAWTIFNQDLASVPMDSEFHVHVIGAGSVGLVHAAVPATLVAPGHAFRSFIDDPRFNGRPNAVLQVVAAWAYPGVAGGSLYYDNLPNLFYDPTAEMWMLSDPYAAAIPPGTNFLVTETPGGP